MRTLMIVGTVREGRKTIHTAHLAREIFEDRGHEVVFYDLKQKDMPYLGNRTYIDAEEPVPEDIQELSREVEAADTLIIVTPEYNHSVPGVLKNALDYLYPEYDGKPFCYITDSGGGFGGIRALSHLHDITLALGGLPGPNLAVSHVRQKFDENGNVTDEDFVERMKGFAEDVEDYVARFR